VERPDLSKVSKEVLQYIEDLEERLDKFTADDTIANLYIGLKRQLDQISLLFITLEIDEDTLKDKDDKFIDRYFKYLEKSKSLAENLIYIEKLVSPEKIDKAKRRADAHAESYIFDHADEKN